MAKNHILIVDDHQDIRENLLSKLRLDYPNFQISVASSCDLAVDLINRNKLKNPVNVLILDLTFKNNTLHVLKSGRALLKLLKENNILIPTVIYTSHDELEHIHPIINSYNPLGYIIKGDDTYEELLFAIQKALKGYKHYTHEVHIALKRRVVFEFDLDKVDEQIIIILPYCTSMQDWEGKILKDNVPLVYKSIHNRIKNLLIRFEVDNEKQLLLKLQRLGFI